MTAKGLVEEFPIEFDLDHLEGLITEYISENQPYKPPDLRIYKDLFEAFYLEDSTNLQLLFSSILRIFMERHVRPELLIAVTDQKHVSRGMEDTRKCRDYLVKHNYLSKKLDPDLCEVMELIASNEREAFEVSKGED